MRTRMGRKAERDAWTEYVTGEAPAAASKYHNIREGKYASRHEADVAGKLAALAQAGEIVELREQVPFILIPSDGKLRAIKYIADFTFRDKKGIHVMDAKGGEATKTGVYRLKRRLMLHVHGITIEEV